MDAPAAPPARVTLFGRPAVELDGTQVALRGGFPVAVLARLALIAGDPIDAESLVRELWHDPPPTAVGTLRANVSRLRAAGLAEVISGGRGGYQLDRGAEVDVLRFRAAAEAALRSGTLTELQRAESLWLGEPLQGVDAPFAAAARAELEDLRRRLAERLAAVRLEAGRLDEVLDGLPEVARRNPTHEEPVRLLALALARSGRANDALEAIDEFTRELSERSGLDPSPALAALRLAIVRNDPEVLPGAASTVVRHAVPLPMTRFVGRTADRERIAAARRESRLVTLIGPGGVGKTRLAVQTLHEDDMDAEQWMLELAPLQAEPAITSALADLVAAGSASRDAIAARLSGAGSMLLLDNAEHVREEVAELVAGLLASSPGLSILVTSREPLGVPGERLVPVATMLGGDTDDAVELFRQRAADAQPGFELDERTTPLVRELVELLDGLPLALELTAARLDVMELGELLRSLRAEESLLLSGEGGGRHASLANTIAWSARMLSPDELELLAQLAGFAGAVPLDAIAGICRLAGRDVREVAAALARKSLVAVRDAAGFRAYRLLEAVKLYARGLDRADDAGAWAQRHAAWFADWVDAREPGIHGTGADAVHREFDALRPDLLLATTTAIESRDRSVALRLVGGQAWHWFIRGAMVESLRRVDSALALPGEASAFHEARALWGAVMLIYRSGEKFAGEGYAKRGLPVAERAGDPTLLALFLACNGMWLTDHGDAGGEQLIDRAEALAVAPWAVAELRIFRSIALIYLDRRAESIGVLQDAAASAHRSGNRWAEATAMWRSAYLLVVARRGWDAMTQLEGALRIYLEDNDVLAVILTVHAAAVAATTIDRPVDAAWLFGAVDRLGVQHGFEREAVNDEAHEAYRRRARQALTPKEWNPAYTAGTRASLLEAADAVRALAARRR